MTFINSIPKLTGQNYGIWREELEVNLALAEIDLAVTEKAPTEPPAPVRERVRPMRLGPLGKRSCSSAS